MKDAGTAVIEVDEFLAHPPDAVWSALVDSDALAEWFMPNDFAPEVGHRFTLDTGNWGKTACVVLEIDPPRLLRYSWRNGPLDTEVTWILEPEGHGTRLLVEHRGFDLDHPIGRSAYDGMSDGWPSQVITSLHRHLRASRSTR